MTDNYLTIGRSTHNGDDTSEQYTEHSIHNNKNT
jgi:hypothetical protein